MEIRLDAWGFVFESGLVDIYIQRSAIIGFIAIFVGLRARKLYLERNPK